MNRHLGVGLVFLLGFASAASALTYSPPAFTGGRGLFRVISARTQGNMILSTSLHGEWSLVNYGPKDPLFQGDSSSAHKPDAHHSGEIHFALSYAATNFLEPSVAVNLAGQADNRLSTASRYDEIANSGRPGLRGNEGLAGIKDFEFAVKAVYPSREFGPHRFSYALGLQPFAVLGLSRKASIFFNFKSALDKRAADSSMVAHGFPGFAGHDPDLGLRFLGDFAVPPAQFHLNLGYLKTGKYKDPVFVPYQDTLYGPHVWGARSVPGGLVDRPSRFLWGAGLEVAAGPWVTLILEGSGERPVGTTADSTGRTYWGGGLRVNTSAGVTVDLGAEGITGKLRPGDPTWAAFFGVSVSASLLKPPKPRPQGTIAGRVREQDTDKPLGSAAVKIAEFPGLKIVLDSLGGFRATVPPGSFHIRALAGDSFTTQEKTILVQDQGAVYLDFTLKRREFPKGLLVGKVTDVQTGDPIMAKVTLSPEAGKAKTFTADPATGIYKGEAPPGVYNATASSPDHLPLTLPVTLQDKETTLQNFALKPKLKVGEKFVIRGMFFDRKGAILPESRVALKGVAQILKENTTAVFEISSHTDSRGRAKTKTLLSQKQAENVRQYLIEVFGIPADRMVARGYGGLFPIDTNRTRAGRAANNRIELKVLSRTDEGK